MKNLTLSIPIILCGIIAIAQPSSIENLNAPVVKFETEIIDYGIIKQGSDGVRVFTFTNTGNSTLIISEAQKSCGCTVPSHPKEPILPKTSSVIKVKYDTKRLGTFNKTVTILSNANRPSITLRIRGTVVVAESLEDLKSNSSIW